MVHNLQGAAHDSREVLVRGSAAQGASKLERRICFGTIWRRLWASGVAQKYEIDNANPNANAFGRGGVGSAAANTISRNISDRNRAERAQEQLAEREAAREHRRVHSRHDEVEQRVHQHRGAVRARAIA